MTAWSLSVGEVTEVLAGFRDASFDALLCDPPYGFSFMGKAWDYDVPSVALWRECLRVLKPGAPLVAFGGPRTYHRLSCGVEDAGFELRDMLEWFHGKGYPKSVAINRVISMDRCKKSGHPGRHFLSTLPKESRRQPGDHLCPDHPDGEPYRGYGTGMKPAHEPIVFGRRPLEGTIVENIDKWGVGALAIDACRIGREPGDRTEYGRTTTTTRDASIAYGTFAENPPYEPDESGRWPANLILDEEAAALLDAEAGPAPSAPYRANEATGNVLPLHRRTAGGYSDSGGPSRFFYCSKVSTKEREAGCEGLPMRSAGEVTDRADADESGERPAGLDNPRAGAGRTGGARNHHPTLKPLSLTTWLARLIAPPSASRTGVILVPFAGAGSEMIGCLKAGWGGVFGIEREEDYARIARARITHWCPESEAA